MRMRERCPDCGAKLDREPDWRSLLREGWKRAAEHLQELASRAQWDVGQEAWLAAARALLRALDDGDVLLDRPHVKLVADDGVPENTAVLLGRSAVVARNLSPAEKHKLAKETQMSNERAARSECPFCDHPDKLRAEPDDYASCDGCGVRIDRQALVAMSELRAIHPRDDGKPAVCWR